MKRTTYWASTLLGMGLTIDGLAHSWKTEIVSDVINIAVDPQSQERMDQLKKDAVPAGWRLAEILLGYGLMEACDQADKRSGGRRRGGRSR